MATVTIRVPVELKRQMEEFDVNWSDILRDLIEERLTLMRRKRAFETMDRVREAIYRRTGKYANASEEVIRWRRLH